MRYIIILISYFVVNVEVEIAGKSVSENVRRKCRRVWKNRAKKLPVMQGTTVLLFI